MAIVMVCDKCGGWGKTKRVTVQFGYYDDGGRWRPDSHAIDLCERHLLEFCKKFGVNGESGLFAASKAMDDDIVEGIFRKFGGRVL